MAELAKRVTLQVTKERVPIHVFDLLMRNFKHETPVNTRLYMQIYVSMHLIHNDYIAIIAFFFCDIKC